MTDTLERREAMLAAMVDAARARGGAGAEFIANGHTNLWLDIAYDAAAALSLPAREVSGEQAEVVRRAVEHGQSCLSTISRDTTHVQIERAALRTLLRFATEALATTPAPREKLEADLVEAKEALRIALDHYDRNVCHHDDTHRGGILWTICDQCGSKWADNDGGFKPFEYPAEIEAAFATLNRLSGEG